MFNGGRPLPETSIQISGENFNFKYPKNCNKKKLSKNQPKFPGNITKNVHRAVTIEEQMEAPSLYLMVRVYLLDYMATMPPFKW